MKVTFEPWVVEGKVLVEVLFGKYWKATPKDKTHN